METLFWTCTCATSTSVPKSNVTVVCREPSELHWLCMYSMCSTPFISCSIGAATVSIITFGEAPA